MDTFTFTLMIFAIAAMVLVGWLYTKPGKRWLEKQ